MKRLRLTRRRAVLWIAFLLVLLPVVFLWMLLGTTMGLRYALNQAADALPRGVLTYARVEGSLWRGARIEGLSLTSDEFDLDIGRLELSADIGRLLRREVRVIDLNLAAVRLSLREDEADAAPADAFPLLLPAANLPVLMILERVRIDDMRIAAGDEPLAVIASVDVSGRLDQGVLLLERLTVVESRGTLEASGRIDTGQRYLTELAIGLAPAAPEWALELAIAGDLMALRMRTEVVEGLPLALDLELLDLDSAQPRWRAHLQGQGIDPGAWLDGWDQGRGDLDLHGEGDLLRQRLRGQVRLGDRVIELQSLELTRDGARVDFHNLSLREGEQSMRGQGHVLLSMPLAGRVELEFDALAVPPYAPRAHAGGRLEAEGTLEAWTLKLESEVVADGTRSTLILDGGGDADGFSVAALDVATDLGRLHVAGRVEWRDTLAWRLDAEAQRFEPGRLGLPLEAVLDLKLSSEGRWGDQGPVGRLELAEMSGMLGETALAGQASAVAESPQRWQAEAVMAVGDGRLSGDIQSRDGAIVGHVDLVDFDPGRLGLPVSMLASGGVRFGGDIDTPELDVDLVLARLRTTQLSMANARVHGRIDGGGQVDLTLAVQDIDLDGLRVDTVDATIRGHLRDHRIALQASGTPGTFDLGAEGGYADGDWRGHVHQLRADVVHAGPWRLESAVALAFGISGSMVERACLSGEERGRLCAQSQLPVGGDARVEFELDALSLALFSPFLFPDGFRRMEGVVEGRGEARREDDAWRGEATLRVPALIVFLDPAGDDDQFLRLDDVGVDASLTTRIGEARWHAGIGEDGRLQGALEVRADADTWLLDGHLRLDMAAAGLEALVRELDSVEGRITAEASLGGTLAEPVLGARASVRDFATDVAAAGIRLSEGTLTVTSGADRRIALTGSVRSGDGSIALEGHYEVDENDLRLRLQGENFQAANLPQARVSLSPQLSLDFREGSARLSGSVAVPSALIDLSRFENAERPSADVIIMEGGREMEPARGLPLSARVTVEVGDDVRLKGFGLDGRLSGSLTVRETPGRAPTGQGNLQVAGRFSAYGRQLEIQRGRLLFSGALDNPLLDVRAERVIEDITVGVQASGEALDPRITLYSRPAMAQSDVLS
ncbi:MAG TPA: translocation/assembly module TamB domain-containing protein, partial [Xanthomonadaceae bacterium]|nr:translocation/assembly module TamB domain-containing protein [Xanthomonadaceae bacterium]